MHKASIAYLWAQCNTPTGWVGGMRKLVMVVAALAMFGCSTPDTVKVASSVNAFSFLNSRYEERCVEVVGPVKECRATNAALAQWKKALKESDEAVQRGGKLPLQIKYIAKLEKEATKCLPR